jgi:hypothetical protein
LTGCEFWDLLQQSEALTFSLLPVLKATGMAEPCNWVIDFESHLQNEVVVVVLLILWNSSSGESSVRNQFPAPVQTKTNITICKWDKGSI